MVGRLTLALAAALTVAVVLYAISAINQPQAAEPPMARTQPVDEAPSLVEPPSSISGKPCQSDDDCMGIEVCCSGDCVECCSDQDCVEGLLCEEGICVEYRTLPDAATFKGRDLPICAQDGKPVIRVFGSTVCPHCKWIDETINSVIREYDDRIVAYHWQINIEDDVLTPEDEESIPDGEKEIYMQFNPDYTTPTFIFGCRYYRIGNAYELQDDLEAEADDFREVIDQLLREM